MEEDIFLDDIFLEMFVFLEGGGGEIRKVFLVVFSETRSSAYMTVRVAGDNTGILRESKGKCMFCCL